jgi:hypothetical protein
MHSASLDPEETASENCLQRVFCHYKSQQTLDDIKLSLGAERQWLIPVILVTQEVRSGASEFKASHGRIVCDIPS